MTGDIDFHTGHFTGFAQFKTDSHLNEFGHVTYLSEFEQGIRLQKTIETLSV